MTFEDFSASISGASPPGKISAYLQALWYDGKNDWDKAHDIIQDVEDKTAAWVHAYLHRKEGDSFNANYWYNRAGKKMPDYSLEQEWKEMVNALL